MKKFVSKIVDIDGFHPYLQVKFDGSVTDKDKVETWLHSLDCVDKANATLNDDLKLKVCIYPIDDSTMEEFKIHIDQCLTKWLQSALN